MPTGLIHAGFFRPGFLRTGSAFVAGLALTAGALAQTPEERCLLDALRQATPLTTVEQLRAGCVEPPTPEPARVAPAPESLAPPPAAGGSIAGPTVGVVRDTPQGLSVAPVSRSKPVGDSPVRRRIEEEGVLWSERFALLPHRPNYLLPFSHSLDTPGTAGAAPVQRNEVKFQVSFKFPLTPPLYDGRLAVFFAYTGQSWWQAYNSERSSPFREYSHEPEVFAAWAPAMQLLGWDWRVASAGFVHQSNGRAGEFSRSWNRLFAEALLDRPGPWWIGIRPWWRIPEDAKPSPDSPRGDDNPDITRYAGHGELRVGYAGGLHNWTLTMRRSLSDGGKGAVQLDYSRPTGISPNLRWHVQYFDGYGENLLDYRTRIRRIGLGVMLNDWY
ncbi:MAG TPA: phospholipase A [Burkholderiaceae bacterium]|nr:phospholipase A [Burkholderiaceae bacterium]